MKHFIQKIGLFLICLGVLDFTIGCLSGFLRSHAKGGSTQNNYYIAEQCTDEIIILGSSRATHHYIPSIITDSLGLSCYNCGEEGNGSILAAARLEMLTERHTPKLVIYEVTPEYDYLFDIDDDYSKYLRYLKPYYYKNGAQRMIEYFSELPEKFKMVSFMYRNNTAFLALVVDNLVFRDNKRGYAPLYGQMNEQVSNVANEKLDRPIVDEKKFKVMQNIISSCKHKNVPLIFVVSPNYYGEAGETYDIARRLAIKNDIPFIDYSGLDGVARNATYFQDASHMNDKGAKIYTKTIVKTINQYLCKK